MRKQLLTIALMFATIGMYAQTLVDTLPHNRNVILEEFTGIHCTYCPDGHLRAQNIKDAHPNNVFLINIHSGSFATPSAGEPDFRTSFGAAIDAQSVLTGYPAGTVNRHRFAGLTQNTTNPAATAMSRGNWVQTSDSIMGKPSYCNVGLSATVNASTRELVVNVEVYFTGNGASAMKLNVALTQDNVEGPQTGMASNPSQVLPNGKYNHNHMLRHLLTGQWGDTITTTAQGTLIQRTYTYTLPASITNVPLALGNLEVVAFIAEGQQEIITGKGVIPTYTNVNFQLNAGVNSISVDTVICEGKLEPKVRFNNIGSTTLTSATFSYKVNNGTASTYNWTGSLPLFGTQEITLPAITFAAQAVNTLSVEITSINGGVDQDLTNNALTLGNIKQTTIKTSGIAHKLTITQDQYGSEITWEVKDGAGTVVASGGPYADLAASGTLAHIHNVNLSATGCYTLFVYDAYGDGFNAGYGVGGYKFQNEYFTLVNSNGKIGSKDRKPFEMTSLVSIDENIVSTSVDIYPNPASNKLNVALNVTSNIVAEYAIYNSLGQQVLVNSEQLTGGNNELSIDLSALSNGFYTLKIKTDNTISTKKFSIVR